MKHTIEFETIIECTPEALFAFHADTNNLPLITPPDTTVTIIKLDEDLKEGNVAVLKIKRDCSLLSGNWCLKKWSIHVSYLMLRQSHLLRHLDTNTTF